MLRGCENTRTGLASILLNQTPFPFQHVLSRVDFHAQYRGRYPGGLPVGMDGVYWRFLQLVLAT
jgi:hypothetical protein